MLILLILMHLSGIMLVLWFICHIRLLHNERTIWRLDAQMFLRILLRIDSMRHWLLLLRLLIKTRVRVDHDRASLNNAWLLLLLIASWSSSFALLIHLIHICIAINVNIAVHLLLLQNLSLRAITLHHSRRARCLWWNIRTLLILFLVALNKLSLLRI